MVWWGRRKTDPPTEKLPKGREASITNYKLGDPLPEAALPSMPSESNVVEFPDKKMSDLNRKAVHALLDKLLDQIGPNDYLVMGIEEPE